MEVEGADASNFVTWESFSHYGKDKNNVYLMGKKVEGADPASFLMIGGLSDSRGQIDGYTKDIRIFFGVIRK